MILDLLHHENLIFKNQKKVRHNKINRKDKNLGKHSLAFKYNIINKSIFNKNLKEIVLKLLKSLKLHI